MSWLLLRRFARNRGDGNRGVAAIEFAAVGTILVILMILTIDLGMGFYRRMQVQNAAQAGAQFAMRCAFKKECTFNPTDTEKAVVSSTGAKPSSSFSGIIASPAPKHLCGCPSGTDIEDLGASPPCTLVCPDGSASGTYVSISAAGTYYTLVPYPSLIPDSFVFTAKSIVRVQ